MLLKWYTLGPQVFSFTYSKFVNITYLKIILYNLNKIGLNIIYKQNQHMTLLRSKQIFSLNYPLSQNTTSETI